MVPGRPSPLTPPLPCTPEGAGRPRSTPRPSTESALSPPSDEFLPFVLLPPVTVAVLVLRQVDQAVHGHLGLLGIAGLSEPQVQARDDEQGEERRRCETPEDDQC